MILLTGYQSKKALSSSIGLPLEYEETSLFGKEYNPDGTFVAAHRPTLGRFSLGREFFAEITMKNGLIHKVK